MIVFNLRKNFYLCLLLIATHFVAYSNTVNPEDPCTCEQTDSIKGGYQDFTIYRNKVFNVDRNTNVVLSNKYGTIDVHTGNQSQVIVKVKITVTSTSQSQADRVFDRINIAFLEGPEFVKTETQIEAPSKNSIIWASNSDIKDCDFRIDYDVTMPAGNRLDITNRHGNTTIAALKTAVKIDQRYGDFRLDGASSATVFLAYGGGELCSLNQLNGSVNYGRLTSPNVKKGRIKSIYSQFRFDEIGDLEIESAYDSYDFNTIFNLRATCKYSSVNAKRVENISAEGYRSGFKVVALGNNADFYDSKYDVIRIGGIKPNFGNINIKGSNTDCILVVDPMASYILDVNGTYTNMSQPAAIKTKIDNREPSRREVMGVVGNSANPKSTIRAWMTYGEFRIR